MGKEGGRGDELRDSRRSPFRQVLSQIISSRSVKCATKKQNMNANVVGCY